MVMESPHATAGRRQQGTDWAGGIDLAFGRQYTRHLTAMQHAHNFSPCRAAAQWKGAVPGAYGSAGRQVSCALDLTQTLCYD